MNQMPRIGLLVSLVTGLAGCPIYGGSGDTGTPTCDPYYSDCTSNTSCQQDSDCPSNQYCSAYGSCKNYPSTSTGVGGSGPTTTSSSTGTGSAQGGQGGSGAIYCGHPSDCAANETCAPDGTCHPGNCSTQGCIFGYNCDLTASPPACKSANPNACGADSDCLVPGDKCVDGVCTLPADQCFDQTQCPSGDVCAAGKCTPSCSATMQCTGSSYTCSGVGTCTVPTKACTITNDCGGPNEVCVDGACVPRSPNGTCDSGFVWVENGCIANQGASFVCSVDGVQDVCAGGSVCLHHSCYISCAAPNQTACSGLPSFNQCKDVTTTSGLHEVCGSSQNLGGQCDPTAGLACAQGLICIDGFCK